MNLMSRLRPRRTAAPEPVVPAAVLSALPVPVLVVDEHDRFRFANPAAEELLGLSAQQLAQTALPDLLPPDSPLVAMVAQVRHAELVMTDHDLVLESPRVRRRTVAVQAAPLEDEPGQVVLCLQDTGAAQKLDSQGNVRAAARSVSGMAAILAHEVKNPLSGIRGAAQLLEQSVGPEDRELTTLIRDEADRIRGLVDRMEAFDDRPARPAAVNIHRVLEHVRRLAETGFGAHVRFTEVYDPSLPPVWGSRDQLVQILLNLVKNAAEAASGPGAEIVLSTAFRHGMRLSATGARLPLPLEVAVRDNGPGIPEDIRPHMFEPFVTGRTDGGGTGLGLALVAKLVADHGGLIECDSRPGRTEFRVFLPALPQDADDGPADD
jgi:two-component system nitrogen regulation sensor histidine kinase GlnL